jgi:hypothetical protein
LTHCSASKSLAFAEVHPYNPLTGTMLRRALLFDSPEMPVHEKGRKKRSQKQRSQNNRKMVSSFKHTASNYTMHVCVVQAVMVQARRQSLRPIGLAVDFSSPKI